MSCGALRGPILGLQPLGRQQSRPQQQTRSFALPALPGQRRRQQLGWRAPLDTGGRQGVVTGRFAAAGVPSNAFDPDTYTEEPEDEDDYSYSWGDGFSMGDTGTAASTTEAASRNQWTLGLVEMDSAPNSHSRSPGNIGTLSKRKEQHTESRGRLPALPHGHSQEQAEVHGNRPQAALTRAYSLLLLCVGAAARLSSRLHTAVLATARVTWQLGGEAMQSLIKGIVRAKDRATQSFAGSPATRQLEQWQKKVEAVQHELPEDLWGKLQWVWERPDVQRLRLTISMANFSIRLPALVALVATQIGLLSTSLSLPMLAPLLLGTHPPLLNRLHGFPWLVQLVTNAVG